MSTTEIETGWKDVLGTCATITTIGQFLSGMFTVKRVYSGQGGNLSPVPFIMGVVGCALWLLYGHLKSDDTIVRCNVVGTCLNCFYVLVFIRFTKNKSLIYRQVFGSLSFLSLVFYYVQVSLDSVDNIGLVCIVVSILCCASPLVSLKEVLRTRSTSTLPFPLILSMFLVCSLWWLYGVLTNDFYMQFTNLLGSLIAVAQLALFCVFNNNKNESDFEKLIR